MTKATKLNKEIGAKIELYRLTNHKTRRWLGEKISRSFQQIQNYETGKHRVAASCLYIIAKVLKTPIDNFFPTEKNNISKDE